MATSPPHYRDTALAGNKSSGITKKAGQIAKFKTEEQNLKFTKKWACWPPQ